MPFPALSVNISPASFLKYTTYSSNTVVSPMMTKTIGGAERRETADIIQQHTIHGKRAHMCYYQQQREKKCDLHLHYICKPLTPSKNEEEPPLLGEITKHQYQHEVGHDAFTQHPAEGRQEEVL